MRPNGNTPRAPVPLFFCNLPGAKAFGFDELERIEKQEQSELLERAKQAARGWNFGAAQNYRNQARNKGYSPKDFKAAEAVIAQSQQAKAADDERKRREEAERQAQAERERAAQQAAYSGGSSGGSVRSVMINVDACYFCAAKNLSVSGGPGTYSAGYGGAKSGTILPGYGGGLGGVTAFPCSLARAGCAAAAIRSAAKNRW